MQAVWRDVILAQSDNVRLVDGQYYFPFESINRSYFQGSTTGGDDDPVRYYDIVVDGQINQDGAFIPAQTDGQYLVFGPGVDIKQDI